MRALRAAVEDFGELIKGEDPLRGEHVMSKLRAASAACGPGGIVSLALSAIDIALWDIRGKATNAPLARLLGGLRDRVPAYASGALMRTTPLDQIERAAVALVEKGFRQIKPKWPSTASRRPGGRTHSRHPRRRRPGHRPDGRHQPTLERARGHRDRPPGRGAGPLPGWRIPPQPPTTRGLPRSRMR